MIHLLAYDSSIAVGTVLVDCVSLPDQFVPRSGNTYIVPKQVSKIGGIYVIGANISQAQLQAPSLRRLFQMDVSPLAKATPAAQTQPAYMDFFSDPLDLQPTDLLEAQVIQSGAGAENDQVLVWLVDGPVKPVTGKMLTLKFTGTTTLTAHAWTQVALTASQSLVPGTYDIVGMRAKSAGAIAARLLIPGQVNRPGVIAVQNDQALDQDVARYGGMGVLGTFDNVIGIQAEYLSTSADTSETVWLDLIAHPTGAQ